MARGRLSALVLLVGALVGLIGPACSREPDRLDPASAQRRITAAVEAETGAQVDAVRCPTSIPLGQGQDFGCTVVLADDGGDLPVTATQRDDQGALDVELRRAVLSDAELADQLKAALDEGFGRTFLVDCGDAGPTVRTAGERVVCRARDDQDSKRSVRVTIGDADGGLRYELLDP